MKLTSLHIYQFRNIGILDWQPHGRTNLLIGPNAQGKTNLLEAIFLLGTTKSLRGIDSELIMNGQELSLVKGTVQTEVGAERSLEIELRCDGKKSLKLNDKFQARTSQMMGQLSLVLFTPEDLKLVKAGPAARRFYLDLEISQASPAYLQQLQVYQRVLKQRNAAIKLLAEGRGERATIEAFETELVRSGSEVILFRLKAVDELKVLAAEVQAQIAGPQEDLKLSYESSIQEKSGEALPRDLASLSGLYRARLKALQREELGRGITLAGPHRDDLEILLAGKPARSFASQGQQRTAALALKLAEVRFLHARLGENPVLLLDDVLSELDGDRRRNLLGLLDRRVQTFITSTHPEDLELEPGQCLEVQDGTLRLRSGSQSGILPGAAT